MDKLNLNELLSKAEKSEEQARELLAQETEGISPTVPEEINSLFEAAWQGYHAVETLARESLTATDSIQTFAVLAQSLMNIHIHPNSGFARDTKELWEAQYLWLHLYYRTGEQAYFKQAQFCDAIRHAAVEKVE